jgi:hypothetical protein
LVAGEAWWSLFEKGANALAGIRGSDRSCEEARFDGQSGLERELGPAANRLVGPLDREWGASGETGRELGGEL